MNGVAFVSGMLVTGYLTIALFFVRFLRDTGDRLFGIFAAAFAILALQRLLLVVRPDIETAAFGLRALAFLLILWAIVDRNRQA